MVVRTFFGGFSFAVWAKNKPAWVPSCGANGMLSPAPPPFGSTSSSSCVAANALPAARKSKKTTCTPDPTEQICSISQSI